MISFNKEVIPEVSFYTGNYPILEINTTQLAHQGLLNIAKYNVYY